MLTKPLMRAHLSTIVVTLLALGLGLALANSVTPPITATDQEQSRWDSAAPLPNGTLRVGQTFLPQHNGLSAIDLLAVVSATPPFTNGVTLRLEDEAGQTIAQRTFLNQQHNAPLRLDFAPQPRSAGRMYTLWLEGTPHNPITVWAYSLDGYARGTQLVDDGVTTSARRSTGTSLPATFHLPLATSGDLYFSTTYTYLWPDRLADAVGGLAQTALMAPLLWLVLFAPGQLLLRLFPAAHWPMSAWAKGGLALALSLSFLSLVWLWPSTLGLRWAAWSLGLLYLGIGASAIALWLRDKKEEGSRKQEEITELATRHAPLAIRHLPFAMLLLLTLATRLLAARDLAFPPWVDSSHHLTIIQVLAQAGAIPANYQPFLPVERFYYHWGYHVLAVTVQWFTQMPWPTLMLWLGQLLNALMPLAVCAGVELFTQRPRAGLLAAFFVALVSFFPGYYLSWGRYTQLVGLLIFAPLVGLMWASVRPPANGQAPANGSARTLHWHEVVGLSLLCAGLFLAHYRILAFLVTFALVALAGGGRQGWRGLGAAALGTALLTLPWVMQLFQQGVMPLLAAPARAVSTGGYNAFPWDYFKGDLERGWMTLAVIALSWGLAKLERPLWVLGAWLAFTFALLNIGPGTWLVNNNAWAISLFLPGALALGWGGDQWLRLGEWLRAVPVASRYLNFSRVVVAHLIPAVLVGLLAYAGWRGLHLQITLFNTTTRLATAADAEALRWVEQNIPATEAVFLINGWQWLNNTWAGADGGAWLWPLIGRHTTLPPIDYTFQADWAADILKTNTRLVTFSGAMNATHSPAPEFEAFLHEQGVTHIFIGAKGGHFTPEMFWNRPRYRLLYSNGAAWVFEVEGARSNQ